MTLPLLLAVSLSTSALPAQASSPAAEDISLSRTIEGRKATLLGGLELSATYQPSVSPPLRLMDDVRFGQAPAPMALDQGGGVGSGERQVLALLLGLFLGFGTGHLVAHDQHGFVLFLIVDLAIIVVSSVLDVALWGGFAWLGGVALLVSHVIQGLDAYAEAGGERLIQLERQRAVRLASAGSGLDEPVITTRAMAFAF